MKDDLEQHSSAYDAVKTDVSQNKRVLALQQSNLQKIADKLENLYKITEGMTNNDAFVSQVEQIQKLVSMSNSTVIASMTGMLLYNPFQPICEVRRAQLV